MTSGAARATRFAPALGVLLLWAAVLLPVLDHGQPEPYDEMAMIDHARRMNTAGMYAYTLDENAKGYAVAGYSKPPGMLWLVAGAMAVLGNTLFAARLPSALSILALAWLALFWARRWGASTLARGPDGTTPLVVGLLWAALIIVSGGALHYGVIVCIEPPLVAVGLGAVTAFALALDADASSSGRRRAVGWAVLAGVLLGAAFLIKQLAAGVATFVVIGLALWQVLQDRRRWPVGLLVIAALPAMLMAGAWSLWVFDTLGDEPFRYMVGMSVVDRAGGFQGTRHFNWLDRFADLTVAVIKPIPLGGGVLGVLWALWRPPSLSVRPLGLPLLLYGAVAVLFFDVISRSVLEWYAMHLLFPLCGGAAFLIGRAAGHLREAGAEGLALLSGRAQLELGVGAVAALLVIDVAAQALFSRLVLLAAVIGLAMLLVRRGLAGRSVPAWAQPLPVAVAVFVLVVGASTLRHERWNSGVSRRAQVMKRLDEEGLTRPSVDAALLGRPRELQGRQLRAAFGLGAKKGAYNSGNRQLDARVEPVPVPVELEPGEGGARRLFRAGGTSVWAGDLTERPITKAGTAAALAKGPLTFEAEDLPAWHLGSVIDDDEASGGQARGLSPWYRTRPPKKPLAVIKHFRLPAGTYTVTFWLKWTCSGLSGTEPIISLVAAKHKRLIKCESDDEGPQRWLPIALRMKSTRSFAPVIQAIYRRGEVALDRIVVERRPPPVEEQSDDDADDDEDEEDAQDDADEGAEDDDETDSADSSEDDTDAPRRHKRRLLPAGGRDPVEADDNN